MTTYLDRLHQRGAIKAWTLQPVDDCPLHYTYAAGGMRISSFCTTDGNPCTPSDPHFSKSSTE
jgi:hypothetical protein